MSPEFLAIRDVSFPARVRVGLGLAAITSGALFVSSVVLALLGAANPEGGMGFGPTLLGTCAILVVLAGWWLVASGSPTAALRWIVRASALLIAGFMLAGLVWARDVRHPAGMTLAALNLAAEVTLFYSSLSLLRRISLSHADDWIATRAVWCMIAVPVLVLGAALVVMIAVVTTLGRGIEMLDNSAAHASFPDHAINWATPAAISLYALGAAFYTGFLLRAWTRVMRRRPSSLFAPANA